MSKILPFTHVGTYEPNVWQQQQIQLLAEAANRLGLKYTPETCMDQLIRLGWSLWGADNLSNVEITQA